MSIEKKTDLYEILLRFGPGGLQGAHAKDLISLVDTDAAVVLSAVEGPARPVTAAECAGLIGAEQASLVEQIAALQAETLAKSAELTQLHGKADALEATNATLVATNKDLEAANAEMRAKLDAPEAEAAAPADQ